MSKAMLAHIAGRLLNSPLMITPEMLGLALQTLGPRIGLGEFSVKPQGVTDFSRRPQYREYSGDGIGLIPVMGPLAYNVSMEDAMCSDIMSYRDIRQMYQEAMDDPLIDTILFAFDSPGGEVAGAFDLADDIYAGRGKKRICGIADEFAASAAYALLSSCSEIFLSRTAGVGSIGVIAQPFDQSKADEMKGFKYEPIFAGEQKNDFNPHFPMSDRARATLQALVDKDYQIFTELVARNRGMSVDAVVATKAAMFQGESAIEAGLADNLMNFQQAVDYIQTQSRNGGQSMRIFGFRTKVQPSAEEPQGSIPEDVVDLQAVIEQARAEGKQQAEQANAEAIRQAREAGANDERARVSAIMDSCVAVSAQLPSAFVFAGDLIKEGLTAQAASDRIIKTVADKSATEAPEITSTVTSTGSGAPNPLLADARRRADAAARKGA